MTEQSPFPCVTIKSKELPKRRGLLPKEMCVGYVYECIDSQGNISSESILEGDLVICLIGGGRRFNMLYDLRNQTIYDATAEDLRFISRDDIMDVVLSIPTTIPF